MCKACGGGTIKCILEKCNNPVEWIGTDNLKHGTPCIYCPDHRHRKAPSTFRDDFSTDYNDARHGWRQLVREGKKFPIEERGF